MATDLQLETLTLLLGVIYVESGPMDMRQDLTHVL